MTDFNALIDKNLTLIFQEANHSLHKSSLIGLNDHVLENSSDLITLMEHEHLIESELGEPGIYYLTHFGHEVIETGGWLRYIDPYASSDQHRVDLSEKLQEELESIMNEPNKKVAFKKIKRKTFAWILGLAALAILLGLYDKLTSNL